MKCFEDFITKYTDIFCGIMYHWLEISCEEDISQAGNASDIFTDD